MHDIMIITTIAAFLCTIAIIFWRPHINEAIPAAAGAIVVLLSGSVALADVKTIAATIGEAAITIMATIVMAGVLESFGFFRWAAERMMAQAKGSGYRLFWYVILLCFLMTMFLNNDGSILITTPILLMLLYRLNLKPHQKVPYLISGSLIATASSASIGVSNLVNLIALKIVGMDLYMQTAMMFVPSFLGLALLSLLLFVNFYRVIPRKLQPLRPGHWHMPLGERDHPLKGEAAPIPKENRARLMRNILLFVFAVRIGLFAASMLGIPIALVAVLGSAALLVWRWHYLRVSPRDILRKTPWHIFLFAFSMYVIVYGLSNIGLTAFLAELLEPVLSQSLLAASIGMGALLSVLSNVFNNHPALMVGTMSLTQMSLDPLTLKIAYLASVIGSDFGSLLFPVGTLATLMWMHLLRKGHVHISWSEYVKVTFRVIPISSVFTLVLLAYWVEWLF